MTSKLANVLKWEIIHLKSLLTFDLKLTNWTFLTLLCFCFSWGW